MGGKCGEINAKLKEIGYSFNQVSEDAASNAITYSLGGL